MNVNARHKWRQQQQRLNERRRHGDMLRVRARARAARTFYQSDSEHHRQTKNLFKSLIIMKRKVNSPLATR